MAFSYSGPLSLSLLFSYLHCAGLFFSISTNRVGTTQMTYFQILKDWLPCNLCSFSWMPAYVAGPLNETDAHAFMNFHGFPMCWLWTSLNLFKSWPEMPLFGEIHFQMPSFTNLARDKAAVMTFIMTYETYLTMPWGRRKAEGEKYIQWLLCCHPPLSAPILTCWLFPSPGDSGEVWVELQEALSTLERSVSRGRSLAAIPQPLQDEERRTQHLSAARESWVKVTQVGF